MDLTNTDESAGFTRPPAPQSTPGLSPGIMAINEYRIKPRTTKQHISRRGLPFRGTFGNAPSLIDPKQTLRWASQNTRGVIPKEKDPKLTAGIEKIVKLQVGIAAMQETNTEWNQFAFRDQYAKAY
jgi:hypothetical protein